MEVKHRIRLDTTTVMRLVDHTLLAPNATAKEIDALVHEAHELGTYAVCVRPEWARLARKIIGSEGYEQRLAVVVDFPKGNHTTGERKAAIKSLAGIADETDVVIQLDMERQGGFDGLGKNPGEGAAILRGLARTERLDDMRNDLKELAGEAHLGNMILKVIVEDAYLARENREKVYEEVFLSGADFIKTSTGFANLKRAKAIGNRTTGAEAENIELMRRVGERLSKRYVGIKASGGVRSYDQIINFLVASGRVPTPDIFRIGCSETGALYEETREREGAY